MSPPSTQERGSLPPKRTREAPARAAASQGDWARAMQTPRPIITSVRPYALTVAALHVLGAACLLVAARAHPVFLGMGVLAYTLGLRHAFDADHIAAIDNTVRKLVQQRENPTGAGFFFSLGHSTVVFLMALATVGAVRGLSERLPHLRETGGIVGTTVSGGFLLLIGLINLYIWREVWRLFQAARRGEHHAQVLDALLLNRGLIARFAGPLLRFIQKSWQVYPVGFLFGLGFDTASEIALLALSAGAASQQLPWFGVLGLPLLFAAGMTLMDTVDGVFMTTAYGWALSTPLRRIYYNLTVTGLSVLAALLIGVIELLQVFGAALNLRGALWTRIEALDLGALGYLLVGLFLITWVVSYGIWKVGRLEERWGEEA